MTCIVCNSPIIGELKYWTYHVWHDLEIKRNIESNIIPFCGAICSLDWYQKRKSNDN